MIHADDDNSLIKMQFEKRIKEIDARKKEEKVICRGFILSSVSWEKKRKKDASW